MGCFFLFFCDVYQAQKGFHPGVLVLEKFSGGEKEARIVVKRLLQSKSKSRAILILEIQSQCLDAGV